MNTYITVDVVRAVGRGQNVIVPVDCVLLLTPVSVSSTGRVVEESPIRFRVKDGVIAGGGAWVVPGTYLISVSNARMTSFYVEIPEGYTEEEPFNIATTMPINMKVTPPWYPTREQMLHIVKAHEDMGIAVDQVRESVAEANSHADRSEDVLRATQEAVSDLPRLIQEAVDSGDYTGPTGRGIASIENRDGDDTATVTYTDGTVEDLALPFPEIMWEGSSLVVGGQKSPDLTGHTGSAPEASWNGPHLTVGGATSPDLTGPRGEPGEKGDPGADGAPGTDGQDGARGPEGPQGDPGLDGVDGADGRGVVSIADDDEDGTATVTYTDGETAPLPLPPGPPGTDGVSPPPPEIAWDGSHLVVGGERSPDLTGPEGAASTVPGPPGAVPTAQDYLVVGPGRPDDSETTGMSAEDLEALPVGAEYRSTDGASINAWGWRKRPTGWVVTDQDAE